ncbi:Nephrin, partial [Eudyptes moseleyi]
ESEAEPVPVLVPDGADAAQLRCRAQGVPGVQLHWEHQGHPLRPEEARFRERQWREGPWTSSLLTVTNITLIRTRLRHRYRHLNRDGLKVQDRNRNRYRYRNWDPDRDRDRDRDRDGDRNLTLGVFVCVARNPLGVVRRRLHLRLAGTAA